MLQQSNFFLCHGVERTCRYARIYSRRGHRRERLSCVLGLLCRMLCFQRVAGQWPRPLGKISFGSPPQALTRASQCILNVFFFSLASSLIVLVQIVLVHVTRNKEEHTVALVPSQHFSFLLHPDSSTVFQCATPVATLATPGWSACTSTFGHRGSRPPSLLPGCLLN